MASSSTASWTQEVERAQRSVIIQISNLTHFKLQLRKIKLDAGEITLPPPGT